MKVREVFILEEALEDLQIGSDFYEEQEEGIGDYFSSSLLSDIKSLRLYAGVHPKVYGFYRVLAKRFPFAIYYDLSEDIAQIIAVLDMRQNPKSIKERLQEQRPIKTE
jgi:hypothetical protein